MRKKFLTPIAFLLLISFAGCNSQPASESIHKRVHKAYYDMPSYSAKCLVTAYTKGSQNDYECSVFYNKDNDTYRLISNDMQIVIESEKTKISKGDNELLVSSSDDDMAIFLNTFFKSYYESESTSLSVSENKETTFTVLECDVINPTSSMAHMKLWVDNETARPLRMQVFGKDNFLNTEVTFKEFIADKR